jgi:hypothetical protein
MMMKPDLILLRELLNLHPEWLNEFEHELIEHIIGACKRIDELEAENQALRRLLNQNSILG